MMVGWGEKQSKKNMAGIQHVLKKHSVKITCRFWLGVNRGKQ